MTEPSEHPVVDMSPATAAALVERGGNLYVWADSAGFVEGAGLIRARTEPPARETLYDTISGEGWAVHIDRDIEPPPRWVIKRKRLPWPHFEAIYDSAESEWSRPTLGGLIAAFLDRAWP
jgi:hypothetical protein